MAKLQPPRNPAPSVKSATSSKKAGDAGRTPEDVHEKDVPEYLDVDSWYSAIVSFVFHFCLVMILPLLTKLLEPPDRTPPPIEVVQVAAATSELSDDVADLPAGDIPEMSNDAAPIDTTNPVPAAQLNDVAPVELPTFDPSADSDKTINEAVERARRAAAAAKAAVAGSMADNLGGKAGGGGTGTGRAGRAARWVLTFDTRSPQDYLRQMGLLGAEIAFPDQGDKYRYFTDLAGSPKSSLRDLASESRIYWVDENPTSYLAVARHLGVGSPPIMVAFLPLDLEEKMLKLELAYKGARSEDEIAQTIFKAVSRGDGYDVIVVDQRLNNE